MRIETNKEAIERETHDTTKWQKINGMLWGALIVGVVAGPWAAPIGAYAGWQLGKSLDVPEWQLQTYGALYLRAVEGVVKCQKTRR